MIKNTIVRTETSGDKQEIFQLHSAAFGEAGPGQLVDNLRTSQSVVISLVAEQAGTIIGHILLSRLEAPLSALSLAPAGVHPDHQNQSVGSILIATAIEEAKRENEAVIFVLGAPAFYRRFGFNAAAALPFISPYNGPDFMALILRQDAAQGGKITYPAAFDQDIINYAARTQNRH